MAAWEEGVREGTGESCDGDVRVRWRGMGLLGDKYSVDNGGAPAEDAVCVRDAAFASRGCASTSSAARGAGAFHVVVEAFYYVAGAGFVEVGGFELVDFGFGSCLLWKG